MRAIRVIFKTLAFIQWLAACGAAVFATATAVDFFDEFTAMEMPAIGGEAAVLMAQLLIVASYVLALFLCLSALYCDNAVARRVGKPRAGDENAGSAPAADSE